MATKVLCDQCRSVLPGEPVFRLERFHRTADICSLDCLKAWIREYEREAEEWAVETVHSG